MACAVFTNLIIHSFICSPFFAYAFEEDEGKCFFYNSVFYYFVKLGVRGE